jgi:hypothetical protein
MSIIKNHLQIELSIDQILYRLRLFRLNELQKQQKLLTHKAEYQPRPGLETRSLSQSNMILRPLITIEENEEQPLKRTEIIDPETMQDLYLTNDIVVKSSQSTPMIITLSDNIQLVHENTNKNQKETKKQQLKELRRERSSTKRGLLMTKPE